MNNPFGKIVEIIIAVLLMFFFPLLYFGLRTDSAAQQVVETKSADIMDTVRTQGYLTKDMYDTFLGQLDATGNVYDVHMEHKELALEPEYRLKSPEEVTGDQDDAWNGENIYHYHPVSTELPNISDPANTDGLNTETNESIMAKAVDGPPDPNHVHTEACYDEFEQGINYENIRIEYKYNSGNSATPTAYTFNIYNVKDGRLLVSIKRTVETDSSNGGRYSKYMATNYDSAGNLINAYSWQSGRTGCEAYLWWSILRGLTGVNIDQSNSVSNTFTCDSFLTKLSKTIHEANAINGLNGVIDIRLESQFERDLLGFIEATLDYGKVTVPVYSVKDITLSNKLYKNAIITRTKSDIFTNYLGEIECTYVNINMGTCTWYFDHIVNNRAEHGILNFPLKSEGDLLQSNITGRYFVYGGIDQSRVRPATLGDSNYNYIPATWEADLKLSDGTWQRCVIQRGVGNMAQIGATPKFSGYTGYIGILTRDATSWTGGRDVYHQVFRYSWYDPVLNRYYGFTELYFDWPLNEVPHNYYTSGSFYTETGGAMWDYVFTGMDPSYSFGENFYYKHGNTLECSRIITSITATNPVQKVYINEPLIATVIVTYLDGSTKTKIAAADFVPNTIVSDKTVTLSLYGEVAGVRTGPFTCPITVTVIPRTKTCVNGHTYNLNNDGSDPGCPYCAGWLKSLEVRIPANGVLTIYRGTALIDNGVVLLATYLNGRQEMLYSGYVDNLDKYYVGSQDVTLSYKGKNTTLKVIVKRNLKQCDVCGRYYELYPDDTDPGCPFCKALIPIFTGNVLKYYAKTYSDEILKELYSGSGTYYFKTGDYLAIDVVNRSETFGMKLLGIIFPNKMEESIHVEYGGVIRDETKVSKK